MTVWTGLIIAILGVICYFTGMIFDYPWLEVIGQLFTMTSYYFLGKQSGYKKAQREAKEADEVRRKRILLKGKLYEQIYGSR